MPARRTRADSIPADHAHLLDAAGLVDAPESYARVSLSAIAKMAGLVKTGYGASEVAFGLGVSKVQVERRRRARSLWAVDDNGSWIYPAAQFDVGDSGAFTMVRGLDRVLHAFPKGMHPVAIAGFLGEPQQELAIDGRPRTVRDWLSNGGPVDAVLQLIGRSQWAGR